METFSDKLRALLLAIGVHLACILLVVLGVFWTRTEAPLSVAGGPIEASLVMEAPASFRPAASLTQPQPEAAAPAPQPVPTPRPQQAETPPQPQPQAPVAQPDNRETERAALLAQQQAEEVAKREEQERRKQEQVLLEEQQRQREAERRERMRAQELAREKELADIRKQREDAERKRQLEADKLQQLADQRAATPAPAPREVAQPATQLGNNGTDDSLSGRYQLAIAQAVTRAWLRPEYVDVVRCSVNIVQIPGGEVIQVSILPPCAADELTRRSMEAAVLKAQPLPYRGFEPVFQRNVKFNFCYPRDRCQ